MKNLSILVISLIFVGCAQTSLPKFPDIKKHFMVSVDDVKQAHCLEFDIVSTRPYKIKFNKEVELEFCSGVGGYTPKDFSKLLNWVSDVDHWAESRPKKCFK